MFQQAALDHLKLDIRYEALPTPDDNLSEAIQGLRAPEWLGANVTIPHKEAVLPLLDEVDDLCRRVGAGNTIVNREGKLYGYNTDVAGFLRALREDGGFDPVGGRVLVAGAGGAARAIAVALIDAGAASITFINRTYSRASRLVKELGSQAGDTALSALPDVFPSWRASTISCRLLINCTSVGMAGTKEEKDSPVPIELISPGALVFDLIYRPTKTPLIAAAEKCGAGVLGGLPMLVYQGAASFRLWTGSDAPLEVMLNAARTGLSDSDGRER